MHKTECLKALKEISIMPTEYHTYTTDKLISFNLEVIAITLKTMYNIIQQLETVFDIKISDIKICATNYNLFTIKISYD